MAGTSNDDEILERERSKQGLLCYCEYLTIYPLLLLGNTSKTIIRLVIYPRSTKSICCLFLWFFRPCSGCNTRKKKLHLIKNWIHSILNRSMSEFNATRCNSYLLLNVRIRKTRIHGVIVSITKPYYVSIQIPKACSSLFKYGLHSSWCIWFHALHYYRSA